MSFEVTDWFFRDINPLHCRETALWLPVFLIAYRTPPGVQDLIIHDFPKGALARLAALL
jgi:hypothetical protein